MTMRVLALLMLLSLADGFYVPAPVGKIHAGRPAAAFSERLPLVPALGRGRRAFLRPGRSSGVCQAAATAATAEEAPPATSDVYACPQCKTPASLEASSCSNCGAPFAKSAEGFTDLTPAATAPKQTRSSPSITSNPFITTALASAGVQLSGLPLRQELFRSPFVSYLYERGWRNSFKQAGFPGIEKEFQLVQEFFTEAQNKTVIDLSCGSGLMVRRLAKSGKYNKVIAVDYSESMLQEVIRRSKEESTPAFDVVRADVACMPFQDDSVDAIHSGAALHCWPSVQDGLKEVNRVLKPGGSFFATTFLWGVPDELVSLVENLSSPLSGRRAYRFFSPKELEWLMKSAGFSDVEVEARDRCALIRCKK
eukprot:CAMPEP_0206268702 /NCGR_PEP_ID=MMETSP0047_2-20121206/31863_1 /ASSEMBLY_ACC=CAM_ASM_000192 /TAXON_ID=195065 /ORGANISM="Chroomonas mesostigmatica_cf, Strain CCMP1168" /LENGTH=365 /DNA_ID=CAMNT_0053697069 /DNA_START=74 /DNA_END=1171 /DNA_ORIENTATION=-